MSCHLVQSYQHFLNGYGDIGATLHTGIPGEGTIRILQLPELLHRSRKPVADDILVEEVGQTLFLLCLTVGSSHPGRLVEHQVLQFLIL